MRFTASGPKTRELAEAIGIAFSPSMAPDLCEVDREPTHLGDSWLRFGLREATSRLSAKWKGSFGTREFVWSRQTTLVIDQELGDNLELLPCRIAPLPFELATLETPHMDLWLERGCEVEGFSGAHVPFGSGVMFKGPGHDYMVSRRWLEFGPWKLHRFGDDVTLVQFYGTGADAETALAQAEPGFDYLLDGYLQEEFPYTHDLNGVYDPATRTLKIPVAGRELTQDEMVDACALRRDKRNDPDTPLDAVGFVFPIPGEHERYVHDLWLRDLHCYAFIDNAEKRVDHLHTATPAPPDWAR